MLVSKSGFAIANIDVLGTRACLPNRNRMQRRFIWMHVTSLRSGISRLPRSSAIIGPIFTSDAVEDHENG
ncbi:unnamed protein product [Hymenolepis diminuta]|uniref:Uncharacterized protein n=1 Tax=Hymenolepis diminuta TaxID=6216 RepID=A0A564Y7B3_HYMDI|nr:unnamed protein product [Hymenolepis diminuta]VUZ43173.1 unnamed protein product [Hymenolepis diminuta]